MKRKQGQTTTDAQETAGADESQHPAASRNPNTAGAAPHEKARLAKIAQKSFRAKIRKLLAEAHSADKRFPKLVIDINRLQVELKSSEAKYAEELKRQARTAIEQRQKCYNDKRELAQVGSSTSTGDEHCKYDLREATTFAEVGVEGTKAYYSDVVGVIALSCQLLTRFWKQNNVPAILFHHSKIKINTEGLGYNYVGLQLFNKAFKALEASPLSAASNLISSFPLPLEKLSKSKWQEANDLWDAYTSRMKILGKEWEDCVQSMEDEAEYEDKFAHLLSNLQQIELEMDVQRALWTETFFTKIGDHMQAAWCACLCPPNHTPDLEKIMLQLIKDGPAPSFPESRTA